MKKTYAQQLISLELINFDDVILASSFEKGFGGDTDPNEVESVWDF